MFESRGIVHKLEAPSCMGPYPFTIFVFKSKPTMAPTLVMMYVVSSLFILHVIRASHHFRVQNTTVYLSMKTQENKDCHFHSGPKRSYKTKRIKVTTIVNNERWVTHTQTVFCTLFLRIFKMKKKKTEKSTECEKDEITNTYLLCMVWM